MVDVSRHIVDRLLTARSKIVAAAANWQRDGIDTAALTAPLLDLQKAVYLLESLTPGEADGDRLCRLGRELGEHFAAVRACGAGLETEDNPSNRLRWADLISRAADHCIATVDRMEPLFTDEP